MAHTERRAHLRSARWIDRLSAGSDQVLDRCGARSLRPGLALLRLGTMPRLCAPALSDLVTFNAHDDQVSRNDNRQRYEYVNYYKHDETGRPLVIFECYAES